MGAYCEKERVSEELMAGDGNHALHQRCCKIHQGQSKAALVRGRCRRCCSLSSSPTSSAEAAVAGRCGRVLGSTTRSFRRTLQPKGFRKSVRAGRGKTWEAYVGGKDAGAAV